MASNNKQQSGGLASVAQAAQQESKPQEASQPPRPEGVKAQASDYGNLSPELQAKLRRLDELDRASEIIEQKEAEIARRERELADREAGGRPMVNAPAYVGPNGGYEFDVGPAAHEYNKNPSLRDHLQRERVRAIDESEAIRWYAATHEHPGKKNRAIDTADLDVTAICIDYRKRQDSIAKQQHLAGLRRKVESGVPLSEHDEATLRAEEAAAQERLAKLTYQGMAGL